MKNWIFVVVLGIAILTTCFLIGLAVAQTPAPTPPTDREKYIQARVGQINAEVQLIQLDLNSLSQRYPAYFGTKGTARKELEAVLGAILKANETELKALSQELAGLRKAQPAPAKPAPTTK